MHIFFCRLEALWGWAMHAFYAAHSKRVFVRQVTKSTALGLTGNEKEKCITLLWDR